MLTHNSKTTVINPSLIPSLHKCTATKKIKLNSFVVSDIYSTMRHNVFKDPSGGIIGERYFKRIIDTFPYLEMDGKEKNKLRSIILLISIKLSSIWNHKTNYNRFEDDLIKKTKANPLIVGKIDGQIEYSQDLFNEFDEFLVQVKSCLDYLVNVPAIIFGKNVWRVATFSDDGKGVIKSLERNVPIKYKNIVPGLVLIIKDQEIWLKEIISARDRINHYLNGGIDFGNFKVIIEKTNNSEKLIVPKWANNQSIRDLFEVVWSSLFRFTEDFTMLLLMCRKKSEYGMAKISLPKGTAPYVSPWIIDLHPNLKEIIKDI